MLAEAVRALVTTGFTHTDTAADSTAKGRLLWCLEKIRLLSPALEADVVTPL